MRAGRLPVKDYAVAAGLLASSCLLVMQASGLESGGAVDGRRIDAGNPHNDLDGDLAGERWQATAASLRRRIGRR
jgi:hypothetical protein